MFTRIVAVNVIVSFEASISEAADDAELVITSGSDASVPIAEDPRASDDSELLARERASAIGARTSSNAATRTATLFIFKGLSSDSRRGWNTSYFRG